MIRCSSASVASLSRPGGNITGVHQLNVELGRKRLELARELLSTATILGLLVNPANPIAENANPRPAGGGPRHRT